MLIGPQYFLLAGRSKNEKDNMNQFFSSFNFTPFKYSSGNNYADTFLHYSVMTPFVPELEQNLRSLIEKIGDENMNSITNSYWPKAKNAIFKSDSTGEMVAVTMQQFPRYYYSRDSSKFWQDQLNDYMSRNDLILQKRDSFKLEKNINTMDELRKTNEWVYFGIGALTVIATGFALSSVTSRR